MPISQWMFVGGIPVTAGCGIGWWTGEWGFSAAIITLGPLVSWLMWTDDFEGI